MSVPLLWNVPPPQLHDFNYFISPAFRYIEQFEHFKITAKYVWIIMTHMEIDSNVY
jgi:hypothetical protein